MTRKDGDQREGGVLVKRVRVFAFVCVLVLNIVFGATYLWPRGDQSAPGESPEAKNRSGYAASSASAASLLGSSAGRREPSVSNPDPQFSPQEGDRSDVTVMAVPPELRHHFALFVGLIEGDPPKLTADVKALLDLDEAAAGAIEQRLLDVMDAAGRRDASVITLASSGEAGTMLDVGTAVDYSEVNAEVASLGDAIANGVSDVGARQRLAKSLLTQVSPQRQRLRSGRYALTIDQGGGEVLYRFTPIAADGELQRGRQQILGASDPMVVELLRMYGDQL